MSPGELSVCARSVAAPLAQRYVPPFLEANQQLYELALLRNQKERVFTKPVSLKRRQTLKALAKRNSISRFERNRAPRSPLDARFLAIKDNFCTREDDTTCASGILQGFKPPHEAWAVYHLKKWGGMFAVGHTNMDEFGMGSHSTSSYYGPVRHITRQRELSAGGSSGGSAMAVVTNQCYLALGTDTGGSVRLPAAYTASVGFKPSYGMISRTGVVPYANSLDTVGIIARSCSDAKYAFEIMSRPDARDPTCLSEVARSKIKLARRVRLKASTSNPRYHVFPRIEGFQDREIVGRYPSGSSRRIGVPKEYNIEELSESVREAWVRTLSFLEFQGHKIVPISLPTTKHALSAYYVLAPAEASSNLAKYDGVRYGAQRDEISDTRDGVLYSETRGQKFGEEVQRRILLGTYSLSADAIDNYFIKAQKVRRLVQQDFDRVFKMKNPLRDGPDPPEDGVDLIVCPTAPTTPPRLSELLHSDPLNSYMNDVFTVPASLAGLPAISVRAPVPNSSPRIEQTLIGMQVIGQYGDDNGVLQFAKHEMERAMGYDWRQVSHTKEVRDPSNRIR